VDIIDELTPKECRALSGRLQRVTSTLIAKGFAQSIADTRGKLPTARDVARLTVVDAARVYVQLRGLKDRIEAICEHLGRKAAKGHWE
jgi:hypothetical protein